jgi:hypothetical protein
MDVKDCETSGSTVTCNYGVTYVTRVVYSTRIDDRSPDGRPLGIITAFEYCNFC